MPYLLDALKKWPSVVDSGTSGQRSRHLDQALRNLEEADEQEVRETIAEECAVRYQEGPNAALAVVWLKGLFRFDPARGARLLADEFEGNSDPAIRKRVIETFAFIFGEDEPVDFRASDRVQHARLLARLVRLARVMREDEVADAKQPDIRLATVGGIDQRVVLEVKIADKGWSLVDLEDALRKQLVGQYLRHANCRGGCLLLTHHGRKKYWMHADTKKRLTFSEVVGILREKARALEQEHKHRISVEVFGLDLTDSEPASG